MGPKAELLKTFPADSFFEAMTIYWHFWEWGDYATEDEWKFEPYPEDMGRQLSSGSK